tara:strand:- start:1 stop:462 length:462 start_codon:yes stop_codon:yes gene_type:complete
MVESVVPQEQMELFNRPKKMPERMPEDMAMQEPEEELTDSGLRRDDPKVALAEFGSFLIDLPPEKINGIKSFIMRYPLVTEAITETIQMPPEDLNDVFDALMGDVKASQRLEQKLGMTQPSEQPQMQAPMQAQQMPMQAEQPPMQMEQGRGLA